MRIKTKVKYDDGKGDAYSTLSIRRYDDGKGDAYSTLSIRRSLSQMQNSSYTSDLTKQVLTSFELSQKRSSKYFFCEVGENLVLIGGVLKNSCSLKFHKFTGKYLLGSRFLVNVQVFSCRFIKIFRGCYRTPPDDCFWQ